MDASDSGSPTGCGKNQFAVILRNRRRRRISAVRWNHNCPDSSLRSEWQNPRVIPQPAEPPPLLIPREKDGAVLMSESRPLAARTPIVKASWT